MKRSVQGEQYFTPAPLAERCIDFVAARFPVETFDLVVEPSAGDGAFFERLPRSTRTGVDIDPRHPEVVRADFLHWLPEPSAKRVLTIGNPPFGQRAALAVDFLDHACSYSTVVAFILPRSFNKYTFQNRVRHDFHLVDSFECSEFTTPDGSTLEVRAVFQVWERRAELRPVLTLPDSHPDFDMKHGHLSRLTDLELSRFRREYEFTIPQVGANFRPRAVEMVTKGSHWFIRPNVPGVRQRCEEMDFSFLDGMNTAHKSLSKRDIIAAYVAVTGSQRVEPTGTEQAALW